MTSLPKTDSKSCFVSICVVESLCVAVIVIAVLIIRLFFDNTYIALQGWCQENLFEKTKITANFDEGQSV